MGLKILVPAYIILAKVPLLTMCVFVYVCVWIEGIVLYCCSRGENIVIYILFSYIYEYMYMYIVIFPERQLLNKYL